MGVRKKIKSRFSMIQENYKKDGEFSRQLQRSRMLRDAAVRLPIIGAVSEKAGIKVNSEIKRILSEFFEDDATLQEKTSDGRYVENAPIWVCWLQGEEDAPTLVKNCLRSIYAHAAGHPLNLITKDTYRNYVAVPKIIEEKYRAGQIQPALFTDYLRMKLIAEHGGFWIDATIYQTAPLPETYWKYPFFSAKSTGVKTTYVSEMRWTTFFLGGWAECCFYELMVYCLEKYWSVHKYAVDYLLTDYLMDYLYEISPAVKKLVDQVPDNNPLRDDLYAHFPDAFDEQTLQEFESSATVIHKLSWRERRLLETAAGEPTFEKYFWTID